MIIFYVQRKGNRRVFVGASTWKLRGRVVNLREQRVTSQE